MRWNSHSFNHLHKVYIIHANIRPCPRGPLASCLVITKIITTVVIATPGYLKSAVNLTPAGAIQMKSIEDIIL